MMAKIIYSDRRYNIYTTYTHIISNQINTVIANEL